MRGCRAWTWRGGELRDELVILLFVGITISDLAGG
jgi:hypothetical protein